jgi:hypothetical protein
VGDKRDLSATFPSKNATRDDERNGAGRDERHPGALGWRGRRLVPARVRRRHRELLGRQHVVRLLDPGRVAGERHRPVVKAGIGYPHAELLGRQHVMRAVWLWDAGLCHRRMIPDVNA